MKHYNQQFEIPYSDGTASHDTFHYEFVKKTFRLYQHNNMYYALARFVGPDTATKILQEYFIGTSKTQPNGTIIWLTKTHHPFDGFSEGLIDLVDPVSGESICDRLDLASDRMSNLYGVDFVPSSRKQFIGNHLIFQEPDRPVVVTDTAIAALVGSSLLPTFTWVALGEHTGLNIADPELIQHVPETTTIIYLTGNPLTIQSTRVRMVTHHTTADLTRAIATNPLAIKAAIDAQLIIQN